MPRSPLLLCLLGYDSNTCYLPEKACPNYRFCQITAAAWPLPYYWDNKYDALVVSFSGASRRDRWNQTVIHHSIEGGSPVDKIVLGGFSSEHYDPDFGYDIQSIWKQAGWLPAQINPNFPFHLDPDYDPIPF